MRRGCGVALLAALFLSAGAARADEDQRVGVAEERTVTGEVTALWGYLREGVFATGRGHTSRARNYLLRGSPVALKTRTGLYIVVEGDRALRSRLADLAGSQVTARGAIIGERYGQPLLEIAHVERVSLHPGAVARQAAGH